MNILHIFKNTNEKFYNSFISFINENFNPDNHYFMIEKYTDKDSEFGVAANVELVHRRKYLNLIKRLYASDKIILHSLMSPRLVILLFFQPWLLKKCYWVIWGSDLYYYLYKKDVLRTKVYEKLRKFCIKRFYGIINYVEGDYELAKKWYGTRAKHFKTFSYTSNLYKEVDSQRLTNKDSFKKKILLGNSADPSNNHIEILERLSILKYEDIELICPLSYGDILYRDKVINFGTSLFGEKFVPLTKFMPLSEYLSILSDIDIAIFAHNRQQALGNIRTLLGMGKKVYMRDDITSWDSFESMNIKVYSLNKEVINFEFPNEIKDNNIKMIKRYFSERVLVSDWKKIFQHDNST